MAQRTDWNLLEEGAGEMFPRFCHDWSAGISPANPVPGTAAEWLVLRDGRRARIRQAMGLTDEERPPLEPQVTGVEDFGDYTLEKVLLRSRPNLVMATHLYVPKNAPKPAPAVLSVHGHWGQGKLAPRVQDRNIGMAKLGFVVLCVDAIGAGERAYRGETYHGRQLGAQALPSGLTLPGLQGWDNSRALDYLCSRPEVDPARIACTGASGGCNQTLYLAALDERVAAAAPVCCIGSLEGYLNGAHCVCELVPGIKGIGEMVDILSLIAPRPLIVVNGIHDGGAGFRIDDMRAQFPKLKRVYELLGAGEKVTKCEVDLGHGYFLPMREAMYAWFRRWLLDVQADLCPEPEVVTAEPERIQCFADGKMPEEHDNVPSLAYAQARRLAETYPAPAALAGDAELRRGLRARLEEALAFPRGVEPAVAEERSLDAGRRGVVVAAEPGIRVPMVVSGAGAAECLLWLGAEGKATLLEGGPAAPAHGDAQPVGPVGGAGPVRGLPYGTALALPDLRGLGETAWARAQTVGVWDYQYFQNGTILGRPMLGQWVWDALQCARILRREFPRVAIGGRGVMAMAALLAGALDEEIEAVICEDLLASYAWPEGFAQEHAMSLFVPGLLRVGDVPQLAALVAPRRLHIAGAVDGGNRALDASGRAFACTRSAYEALGAEDAFLLGQSEARS